jgi:magnesium transporter
MIMLSQLRRFYIVDQKRQRVKLVDLSIELLESDYPPVTKLFFYNDQKEKMAISWDAVEAIDRDSCEIRISDFSQSQPVKEQQREKAVLLCDDILDALILDLQNRRATRANDLMIEEENGKWVLRAVDTSTEAFVRRLSRGLYRHVQKEALYDWKYIEFLRGDPHAVQSGAGYNLRVTRLPPGEIANLSSFIPYLHAAELLILLPDDLAADTLETMTPERQLQVFEELDEKNAINLLHHMAPDIAADLVGRLHSDMGLRYLQGLPKERSERIIQLLRYPEDTVGGIMTNDIVVLPARMSVKEARAALKDKLKEPDFIHFIYVVDDEQARRLRGVITLRDILIADDEQRLKEILNPYIITLEPLAQARDSAHRVISSHLAALPVVGREGQLIGAVTIDAAIAQVAPASWGAQTPRIFS